MIFDPPSGVRTVFRVARRRRGIQYTAAWIASFLTSFASRAAFVVTARSPFTTSRFVLVFHVPPRVNLTCQL